MIFQVDFKSGKPVYLQLVDQVRYAAASGALKAGEPLPSIRPLSEQLRLNRNTVAKAYTELESVGVIETIPGKGCFLKENNSPFTQKVRDKLLAAKIDEALVTAYQLRVDSPAFLALAAERVEYFERKNAKATPEKQQIPTEEPLWTPTTPSSTSANSNGGLESWTPLTD
ncbi:MAG: GntR family transcriptional regulator [Verrucomicrobiota bacterium]|jgi:GntR family transcriptional regulator